ncbi:hypothetical protein LTS18_005041 [Coniosporium uncinatum]|uniref:Uncharacterized protein n=1 Tax=Coniosporium uncinatum TaxID=93489 RepID=A0ACC3DRU4_9PEZI|nr:hypothetical protein LTS18_005041 [Coniosporium uncinatum]
MKFTLALGALALAGVTQALRIPYKAQVDSLIASVTNSPQEDFAGLSIDSHVSRSCDHVKPTGSGGHQGKRQIRQPSFKTSFTVSSENVTSSTSSFDSHTNSPAKHTSFT